MDSYVKANQDLWDRWTDLHAQSSFYDLDGFRRGATSLKQVEIEEVGPVSGKRLLHLQCHFGLDSLSWARRGARVTGVDFSPRAIDLARTLSRELEVEARFLCCDVYELDRELETEERFDIVFASYGVIDWLPDLDGWARVGARRLAPGGFFYLVEFHPLLHLLDEEGRSLVPAHSPPGVPVRTHERGSYADPEADLEGESFTWQHGVADVVMALLRAGLELEHFREFPYCSFDAYPFTVETEPGRFAIEGQVGSVPMMFSLKARRPPGNVG